MRMWMVDPSVMCRQHLLGEHSEIHKHRHNFVKQHSIAGRVENGQIEPKAMKRRHNQLAREMRKRGYQHNSEYIMPDLSYLSREHRNAKVDQEHSLRALALRCNECKKLIKAAKFK